MSVTLNVETNSRMREGLAQSISTSVPPLGINVSTSQFTGAM